MQQITKELIVFNGFSKSKEFRGKSFHLGVILISSHRKFPGVIEFAPEMLSFGAGSSSEHTIDCGPGSSSRLHSKNMGEDV
jgi:hypothetical protein